MISGTRPTTHLPRKKYHQHFGSFDPAKIPDFSVDSSVNGMPDQDQDNAHTECTGYAITDVLADLYKRPFSPDFSYAANFYVTGEQPSLDGASFTGAAQGAVAVGVLPKEKAEVTALLEGELFVANWSAWNAIEKKLALAFVQIGSYNVLGNGDAFDSILSACYSNQLGVLIGSPWFMQWMSNIQGGIVQAPILDGNYQAWHCYAVKGKKTIKGVPYLMVKSWQGTRVGDGGWLYFSRETINAALSVRGSGAITIAKTGNRWISLLGILISRFPALWAVLPQLLKLQ